MSSKTKAVASAPPDEPTANVVRVLLVVIPAWNEAATIGDVVGDARRTGNHVLVVDDGSTDATAQRALAAGATVVRLPVNLGVGAALRTAFLYAVENGYDTVVQCDADGQHPVGQIDRLLTAPTSLSLVIGSRFIGDDPATTYPRTTYPIGRVRAAGIAVLRRRLRRRTGLLLTDPTSGFRLLREPLLSAFSVDFPASYLSDTFEAVQLAADLLGPDGIGEVAVDMRTRQGGVASETSFSSAMFMARTLLVTNRLFTPRKAPLARTKP